MRQFCNLSPFLSLRKSIDIQVKMVKLSKVVNVAGNTLASLVDEAHSVDVHSIHQAVLFGTCRIAQQQSTLTDTQDEGSITAECKLCLTSFLNFKIPHPFFVDSAQNANFPVEIVEKKDKIVGIVSLRKDGGKRIPSFRDVMVAKYLLKHVTRTRLRHDDNDIGRQIPMLILIVDVDPNQKSWIFGMNFICYGVTIDDSNPILLDVTIPSLASDVNAEYRAATCLSTDFHSHHLEHNDNDDDSGIGGGSGTSVNREASISAVAAGSIQQSVELELLAAGLVSDIGIFYSSLYPLSRHLDYPLSLSKPSTAFYYINLL